MPGQEQQPTSGPAAQPAESSPREGDLPATHCVLVVDDAPVSRALVQRCLSRQDYTVLVAASAQEALELYRSHHPAVFILDWMMPDRSGLDLCRQIRTEGGDSYTYILMLTSLTQKDRLVEALEAGADDYLSKPFYPGELLARVRVGLRLSHLQRELAEKNRWLEQLSLTDPLTGIPNRRAIEEWTERQLYDAARHGYPLSIALADLDHFKVVNDTHGHAAGDAALKHFTELLRQNTRRGDFYGRFGGEEFLLVLPHTSEEQARVVLERIRTQLEAQPIPWHSDSIFLTVSFGLTSFCSPQKPDFKMLVGAADQLLYDAKRRGRNQVGTAPTEKVGT